MRHLVKLFHLVVGWSFLLLPIIPSLFGHPARINFWPIMMDLAHEIFLDNLSNIRLGLLYLRLFGNAYQRFVSSQRLKLNGFLSIIAGQFNRVSVITTNSSIGQNFSILVCLSNILPCKTKFVEILVFKALSHLRSLHLFCSLWTLLRLVKIQLPRMLTLSGKYATVILLGV